MIYELWHSVAENSLSYIARTANYEELLRLNPPDSVLIWSYDARSHFEAMRARNVHLGWNPYVPEPDWQDTFYD
jgi:hypothetical protein